MASQKEITQLLQSVYGVSMTAPQVLEAFGVRGHGTAGQRLLQSIDSFCPVSGGHRRYLAIDVSKAIYKRQEKGVFNNER